MATNLELETLLNNPDLSRRVTAALLRAAASAVTGTGTGATAAHLKLANKVFASPAGLTKQFLNRLLAENANMTVSQILGVSDATINAAVLAMFDDFAG